MSTLDDAIRGWADELFEIADRLEAGALRFRLNPETAGELQSLGERAGALAMDAPWAAIPHAEAVMEIAKKLRGIAADAIAPNGPAADADRDETRPTS